MADHILQALEHPLRILALRILWLLRTKLLESTPLVESMLRKPTQLCFNDVPVPEATLSSVQHGAIKNIPAAEIVGTRDCVRRAVSRMPASTGAGADDQGRGQKMSLSDEMHG